MSNPQNQNQTQNFNPNQQGQKDQSLNQKNPGRKDEEFAKTGKKDESCGGMKDESSCGTSQSGKPSSNA